MKSDMSARQHAATRPGDRYYGVYPAVVAAAHLPGQPATVGVRIPMFASGDGASVLPARVTVPMAGDGRGFYCLPEVDDEVLVAFQAGDPRKPLVIGALWNGEDAPPVTGSDDNDVKAIVSRSGLRITLDDSDGAEKLTLETSGGLVLALDDGDNTIAIADDNGNRVEIAPGNVRIQGSANVVIQGAAIELSAGSVKIEAGMTSFNGAVKCDALITNSVISSSYTPGAGNIW